MRFLSGIGITDAIVIGTAIVIEREISTIINSTDDINIENEVRRINVAIQKSREQIEKIICTTNESNVDIMRIQLDFLEDPSFTKEPVNMVRDKKISAEEAIIQVTEKLNQTFHEFNDDSYLQERATDIKDIGQRILANIAGKDIDYAKNMPFGSIVIANDLVPTQTAQLDRSKVLGFITQAGGRTSHTAIMARAMNIAAVVCCPNIMDYVQNGDTIIINSEAGEVIVSPDEAILIKYQQLKKMKEMYLETINQVRFAKLQRSGGERVFVAANIGNPEEAELAKQSGADGIGLFRTEFLFMNRTMLPSEEEQFEAYKKVAETFTDDPVIIRTLDVGGDKDLPYLTLPQEDNPYLGVRAIRLCLKHQDIFMEQLRAILRASAYGNIKIMFPMISTFTELIEARQLLRKCTEQLDERGIIYNKDIKVGVMIEVPAAALIADKLAGAANFFSIGTNDLTQYTLAVDRGNPGVITLYDSFHPAVLHLIESTIQAAHKKGIPCYMCGEMASDKKAINLLSEYGLDEFSVGIDAIAQIKNELLSQKDIIKVKTI